jgi:hypothetical protein
MSGQLVRSIDVHDDSESAFTIAGTSVHLGRNTQCSASGALLLVFAPPGPAGAFLITAGSGVVVVMFLAIVRRQPSVFAHTMLIGAVMWLVGNVWWATGAAIYRVVCWWMAFVVLTIAGERLELNRLLRPTAWVRAAFVLVVTVLTTGVLSVSEWPSVGARVIGIGLLGLTWWLSRHDIARHTVRQQGLTRYMATCLLAGYVWLGVAGVLLLVVRPLSPGTAYDAMLHAVFVGFVLSMIFGHSPIVLPATLRTPLPYRRTFYLPLAVLHGSLVMRLAGDLVEDLGRLRAWGGLFNALALLLFVGNTARLIIPATFAKRSTVSSSIERPGECRQ